MAKNPLIRDDPPMDIEEAKMFLDQVARGCTSGEYREWGQLRPACETVLAKLAAAEATIAKLRKTADGVVSTRNMDMGAFVFVDVELKAFEAELPDDYSKERSTQADLTYTAIETEHFYRGWLAHATAHATTIQTKEPRDAN